MPNPHPLFCPHCGGSTDAGARFCRHCGAALKRPATQAPEPSKPGEEVVLTLPHRMRVEGDRISLHSLQQMVNEGVEWWRMRLRSGEANRAEAAQSIEELSRALGSVSHQLAQGRETIRITTRLPAQRHLPQGCPRCGKGNRIKARFCIGCGRPFAAPLEQPQRLPRLHWTHGVLSDPGVRRAVNQDAALVKRYFLNDSSSVLCGIVADGMGGAQGGERASSLAIQIIDDQLKTFCASVDASYTGWRDVIRAVVAAANAAIFREAEQKPQLRGMGTTIVLVLVLEDKAFVGSIGDSRVYLINPDGVTDTGNQIMQLTIDHTIVARLVDLGQVTAEEARTHPQRNMLYRAVGVDATVECDIEQQPLEDGDILLLCSDGLFNEVTDAELRDITVAAATAQAACAQLVLLANQRGARDNVSALVLSTREA